MSSSDTSFALRRFRASGLAAMRFAFGLAPDGGSPALDTRALGLGRALPTPNAPTEGAEGFRLHDGLHLG